MIHTGIPFSTAMNLGAAYNAFMDRLAPDDWACLLDHDAIWTTREWYKQLEEVTRAVPDAGMVTALQSRGWQKWQIGAPEKHANNHDMAYHRTRGKELLGVRTLLDVTETSGIAGVVMLISKRSWEAVGGFADGMYCVDHAMHFALARAGRRVYVHEGVYVYHWRRANGDAPPREAPTVANCPCARIRRTEKEPKTRIQLP
jgi:GT2 family glycosyltransferase